MDMKQKEQKLPDGIKIGSKYFCLGKYDYHDGTKLIVEVSGSENNGFDEILPVEELKHIRLMDLPDKFNLFIFMPTLPNAPEIENLNFKKLYNNGSCVFSVSYTYQKWKSDKNLKHYLRGVAAKILAELTKVNTVSIEDDEYGVTVNCSLNVAIERDLYEFINELELDVRNIIDSFTYNESSVSKPVTHLKPDEEGAKWWIRYVFTPLVGSAALLAIIKTFL